MLEDLLLEFNEIKSEKEFENLLYKTEELMLLENQDWFLIMKFVKLEPI